MPSALATAQGYHLDDPDGGLDGLTLRETAVSRPGPTEVVIEIRAASLNRRDVMILDRAYPLPAAAGVVPAQRRGRRGSRGGNAGVPRAGRRPGSRHYFRRWIDGPMNLAVAGEQTGCTYDGMLAEYQVIDEMSVVRIPDHLSFEEAANAALRSGARLVALNTPDRPLAAGETVLTVGTGAVALFGIQVAAALGARVIAVTSGAQKADRLISVGAWRGHRPAGHSRVGRGGPRADRRARC